MGEKLGKNLSDIQDSNRSLVLNTLRENPNCSRSEIAHITGLRHATITKIINDLVNWGIVVETELLKNARGRRSIGLQLNADPYRVIGLRLQRTRIFAGLYDISGKEYRTITKAVSVAQSAADTIQSMVEVIRELRSSVSNCHLLGIGVGLPGPYLRREGVITFMADFPGWEGHNIRSSLEREFGGIVYIEHDAHANALAEWWFGHQRSTEHSLLSISMEEGLGAGLVVNGKPYYGTQGVAGEIGHISIDYNGIPCPCGSRGCLRNYCSDTAVVRRAMAQRADHPESVLSKLEALQLSDILQAALAGDTFAISLIEQAGKYLGYGLISVTYMYNPGMIVLSHQFASAGDLFLEPVRETLRARLPSVLADDVEIRFSTITQDPVLMGMVALVTDKAFLQPSSTDLGFGKR